MVIAHRALPRKAQLVLAILDSLVASSPQAYSKQLSSLAALPARPPLGALTRQAHQLQEHALVLEMTTILKAALALPDIEEARSPSGERQLSRWGSRRDTEDTACSVMCDAFMQLSADMASAQSLQQRCAP
jgi:hypothetical protein